MEEGRDFLAIKNWAEEDRPREKLALKGKAALSDAELIAILLRTGVKGASALDIAKKILHKVNGDLNQLGKLSLAELKKLEKGLGDTKATTILAALELGRRRQATEIREKPVIRSSRDSFDYIYPEMADLGHEAFFVLYLNRANKVLTHKLIGTGGVSGTVAELKIILKHAVELLASGMIAVHNHPSGNLKPSQADRELTRKLKEAAQLLDILLLDHLITGEKDYYSFADNGIL
ncbi:MAG TPA: DNA repair protein RadC [Chitinophagales bacterium]|nr:DNA repair protein RadC [Chitinophagales bacterium]